MSADEKAGRRLAPTRIRGTFTANARRVGEGWPGGQWVTWLDPSRASCHEETGCRLGLVVAWDDPVERAALGGLAPPGMLGLPHSI
jgi:hypothetical protein